MMNVRHMILAVFMVALLAVPALPAAAADSYTVAILPFSTSDQGDLKELGESVPILLNAHMSNSEGLVLVERGEIDKALDEIALGISGTVDPATAARIGYLTGAQVLVTGRIFPVQKDVYMVAKIIGVETGRVYGETIKIPQRGDVGEASMELASKIAASIAAKGDTLVGGPDKKEDVVATLKDVVQGKELPSVSVVITEESLDREVVDPAAQTEIATILHQLGFTLVDPAESNVRADVEITGEAFSEFGMRKGNLVSSKGRVELKAVDVKSGEIIHVGRDTAVAVDLSREIAGKTAIAKAAAGLLEELVGNIVR